MLIEQAIFTSARTEQARGYQLVAMSSGVQPDDARQLAVWGPSHGSLSDGSEGASSTNFHPLPSGNWCVSRSSAAGPEYSGRGGARVYTQCLIVPSDVLARFGNNPLTLLRAARAGGMLQVHDPIPPTLQPFELPGRADAVDEGLLAEWFDRWDPRRVAWLVQSALTADSLIVVGSGNAEWLAAVLLGALPVECRPELSFTTGLAYSPRRPFRIHFLMADGAECRRLQRQPGVTLLDLNQRLPDDFAATGWAAYLEEAVRSDRLLQVVAELARPRPTLRLPGLACLAEELVERLHDEPLAPTPREEALPASPHCFRAAAAASERELDGEVDPGPQVRAHSAHGRFAGNGQAASTEATRESGPSVTLVSPSALLTTTSHELLEKLERLDDLVFDTINGRRPALEELTQLWPQLTAELPRDLLQESREQYLRYAVKLWESCLANGVRDPHWAVAALDVLCVLFDER